MIEISNDSTGQKSVKGDLYIFMSQRRSLHVNVTACLSCPSCFFGSDCSFLWRIAHQIQFVANEQNSRIYTAVIFKLANPVLTVFEALTIGEVENHDCCSSLSEMGSHNASKLFVSRCHGKQFYSRIIDSRKNTYLCPTTRRASAFHSAAGLPWCWTQLTQWAGSAQRSVCPLCGWPAESCRPRCRRWWLLMKLPLHVLAGLSIVCL